MPHRCATALLMLVGTTTFAQDLALRDGDRVLFYGDSITEQRLYTTYVETFFATRYPKMRLSFTNAGVGGDTTWGGWMGDPDTRMKRDVAPAKPTVITVMLGMNDAGYVPFDARIFSIFQEWYGKLVTNLGATAPGARLTLIGSSPYDDFGHPETDFKGYDQSVARFAQWVPTLAKERNAQFVDFHAPVSEFIREVAKTEPPAVPTIIPDAIHPGPNGHLVMAFALLKGWNVEPVVSRVSIDAASGRVEGTQNARVTGLKDLQWKQKDGSLPFPNLPEHAVAWQNDADLGSLNQQVVAVRGLAAGSYTLEINGKAVTTASAEDWSKGVNLANLATPMQAQAAAVHAKIVARNELAFLRARNIEFTLAEYKPTAAASALRKLESRIVADVRRLSQPMEHVYRLVPK